MHADRLRQRRPARRCVGARGFFAALLMMTAGAASPAVPADRYPVRPVRIVTSEVGGGLDFVARLTAVPLGAAFGQQVIVDNRPSGVFTGSIVSKAAPDGHTLL